MTVLEHDFSGVGEQMTWLTDEADGYDQLRNDMGYGTRTGLQALTTPTDDRPDSDGEAPLRDWLL